jgi:hypothetical protein
MSNFDSDGPSENEWNDRGELAWNEFDWERYLREQDETINRYLAFYETHLHHAERVDEVARNMGWDDVRWDSQDLGGDDDDNDAELLAEDFGTASEIYTLHKNPIYIATKALYLRARRNWELLAGDPKKVPQPLALSYLSSLHYGEDQAVQAIQSLEFGDYAMAISLFKRSLSALNQTLALLNSAAAAENRAVGAYRQDILISLFDVREIWLRVINECRSELQRPIDDDEE